MFNKLRLIALQIKQEIKLYQSLLKDNRTPVWTKWLLAAAVGYLLSPIDLIPDWIPIIGHIDDLIIVPLLIMIALKGIPNELIEEYRNSMNSS